MPKLAASLAGLAVLALALPVRVDDAAERASTVECLTLSSSAAPPPTRETIAVYERCRDLDPHDVVLLFDLATLYEAVGDPRAEAAFRQVLTIDPAYAAAHVHLGWLRLRAGDVAAARSEVDRALALTINGGAALALKKALP